MIEVGKAKLIMRDYPHRRACHAIGSGHISRATTAQSRAIGEDWPYEQFDSCVRDKQLEDQCRSKPVNCQEQLSIRRPRRSSSMGEKFDDEPTAEAFDGILSGIGTIFG
jgi:hypothetical protein